MLLLAALLLPGWSETAAQGPPSSTVTGVVLDPSGAPVPNASLALTGSTLIGGVRTTTAQRDGSFRLPGLPPGTFTLSAQASGFSPAAREVVLRTGTTLVVDLRLPLGGVQAHVEVSGRSGTVDVGSAAAPAHIDQEMLHHLPTSRSVADLINLAPGVASNVGFGGTQATNAIYADGVDITESQRQEAWNHFNYNWVRELNVVALGAGAEYGEFTGVSAHVVLRSGSNRLSGLGEYWTTRRSWLASNTAALSASLQQSFAPRDVLQSFDTSGQLGGPVVRDRVWFFGGMQHRQLEDRPAGYEGSDLVAESEWRSIGKLTAALARGLRVEGRLQRTLRTIDGDGLGRFRPIETSHVSRSPQTNWNGQLTWVRRNHTLIEATHGGFVSDWIADPRSPSSRSGPFPRYDMFTNQSAGNASEYVQIDRVQHTTGATVTRYVDRLLGKGHELKAGVEFEWAHAVNAFGYPGGRLYLDYDGVPVYVYLWAGDRTDVTSTRTALFVRDRWAITDDVTVEPGVRIDANRGSVRTRGRVFGTTPVSPRVGVAWNVARARNAVIRAHYGRYHDAMFNNRVRFMDVEGQTTFVFAAVVGPDEFEELDRYEPTRNFTIDPAIRHSYVDQYVAGYERQIRGLYSIQGQYVHRRFERFMGLVDVGSVWEPVERLDPGPDGLIGTADDGALLSVFRKANPGNDFNIYTNPPDAFRHYHALQAIARKRYANGWQLQASYTWSRSDGTVGNAPHTNTGNWDLGNPGVFVNPNLRRNARGPAPLDFTHEVKVFGSYRVPLWGGWNVSGVYRHQTGVAWGRLVALQGLVPPRVRLEPRGTRRLPAINTVDLRLEKTFRPWFTAGTAGLFVDVFNAGNQAVPNSNFSWAVVDVSGPHFGQPNAWLDPRRVQAGIRYSF